jgi:hypothetical protein
MGNVTSNGPLVDKVCEDAFDLVVIDGNIQPLESSYGVIQRYQILLEDQMHSLE